MDDKGKATTNPQDIRTSTTRSRREDEGGDEDQSPPYSWPAQSGPTANRCRVTKDRSRQGIFSHHFSSPFLVRLKSPKASLSDPFWRPKSAQDRSKSRLETNFLQKGRFFKKRAPPRARARFWPSGGPKMRPRSAQDRPKMVLRPF